ncbi:MAG: transketolase [Oligoflexia bacterium]|nr:transketolase [Oligoflexia bacterium]
MRIDFTQAVHQALAEDPASLFITGDLGYNALENLAATYGTRFLNAGVAEQNMIGVAAGIALAGHRPWVYSIAPFAVFRCLEQIRNDVCLHQLPVRLVGNGGGYTYGIMGSTHHALEDLGVLKGLPNMELFFPGTNDQVAAAVRLMRELAGPSYLRLAISGFAASNAPLSENPRTLTRHYARGTQVTVIGVGHAVQIALTALNLHGLAEAGADVFGVARFPFDLESDQALLESVRRTRSVLVLDEHYLAGSIAESLKHALPTVDRFESITASYQPTQRFGTPAFMLRQAGLTPEAVKAAALRLGAR